MHPDRIKICVALSLVPGLGAGRIQRLLQEFGTPDTIFDADKAELMKIPGIGKTTAAAIHSFKNWGEVDRILSVTAGTDAWLISLDDEDYPHKLRHIYDPPILLWGRGDKQALKKTGIAVVGTRKPSPYGTDKARLFSAELSHNGLSVISGLAYGIDTIAHTAAVDAGGVTVAVLGSGIDNIYPSTNRRLVAKIMDSGGAVISEFPPGTKPDRENFPVRNRVVSGLSSGVLVVESDVTGGSMLTAYAALDQGREVFAIPHDISSITGRGCNTLIKKGNAKLTMDIRDILDELNIVYRAGADEPTETDLFGNENRDSEKAGITTTKQQPAWRKAEGLPYEQKEICKILEEGPMHIDDLAEKLEKPGHTLLAILLELELQNLVEALSGKRFKVM